MSPRPEGDPKASRTLIVGDVHGCAEELRRLVKKADPDRVILVGDLFSRGPDPRGVWALIKAHDMEAVLGNQDEVVLNRWRKGEQLPKKAFKWLARRPLWLELDGIIVVHAGLHPKGLRRTRRAHALEMRDWKGKAWFKRWKGPELVVHGHDARRGLVDRRPRTLGLDTGCVRGGRLTGYLVEEDRIISVRARQAYV